MSMLIIATHLSSGMVGFLHPIRRAQQSELFAGERHEQNAAVELTLQRREQPRQFQHARGAGSVVVGAGMNLTDLRWRQRIGVAAAQVIVVRADDDVLVGLAGQIRQHIVDLRVRRLDVDLQ